MSRLLIQNARIIDPSDSTDGTGDLLIRDKQIEALGEHLPADGCDGVLDAKGMVLAPGFIDMHVHLRDPGYTHKEDIYTGCEAAAAGGFTAVACMPNTKPVCDCPEVVQQIIGRAKTAKARVYPVAAITQGLKSETPTSLRALKAAGAVAVSDDGRPVTNNRLLLEALYGAQREGLLLTYHAEDLAVTNGGIMHKGEISRRIQAGGVDRASEDVSTAGVIALAAASETPVHICHVSTKGAVALIRDAKRRGVRVTCETGPHYFTLTHEKLLARDANFRMAPPLREESDRQAILEGIKDGTIDCIATDHAPHTQEEKADFEKAPNGVIGLETSLALCMTHLVHTGIISLPRLMEMMSSQPAHLLGVQGGTLRPGAPADLVLFDPDEAWVIDKEHFRSKARNTCFDRAQVRGRVKYTVLDGAFTFRWDG